MEKLSNLRKTIANNSKVNNITVFYCLAVLIYQALYLIIPFRQLLQALSLEFISSGLAVLGLLLFAWDFLVDRIVFKTKFSYFLFTLIGIMGISSLITIQYGIIDSAKNIIWQVVQMLVIFPLYKRVGKEQWSSIHRALYWGFSAVFIPANIISLYQFLFNISYYAQLSDGTARQGLTDGRLFGIYTSPHFTSIFLLYLAFTSAYFFFKTKKKILKAVHAVFAISHLLHVALSGTRSVIVGTACAAVFVVFIYLFKRLEIKNNKKLFTKIGLSAVSALCSLAIVIGGFSLLKTVGTNTLYTFLHIRQDLSGTVQDPDITSSENTVNTESDSTSSDNKANQPTYPDDLVDREDTHSGDISNNRFKIWMDHLTVITSSPLSLLFGNSPGNYMTYIKNNFSDLYIVQYIKDNYPLMYENNLIYDVHNAYLGAFATTGLLGLLVLLAFLICGLIKTLRFIFKSKTIQSSAIYLLGVLVFILVSSFFDSDLFFKCTSTSVIFWLLCGMLLLHCDNSEKA